MSVRVKTFVPPNVASDDEHVVRRLAWALLKLWPSLSPDVQEQIRKQAIFTEDREPTVQLAQQIEIFINKHSGGKTGKDL
jgi:hypothetical protein